MLVGNGSSELCLYLSCYVKVIKDGQLALVQLDHFCTFGCYQGDIILHLLIDIFLIDVNVFVARIEQIPQHAHGAACLFVCQCRGVLGFLHATHRLFPSSIEYLHLLV